MGLTEELVTWTHEKKCLKAVDSLVRNGFGAVYCATPQEAFDRIITEAGDARTVGFGGSMSIAGLEVEARLREMGKEILNHASPDLSRDERMEIMRCQLTCDLFLSGTNALTLSGELVNIDATGNRAAAMFFGPRKVIVVVGRNKLVDGTTHKKLGYTAELQTSQLQNTLRQHRFLQRLQFSRPALPGYDYHGTEATFHRCASTCGQCRARILIPDVETVLRSGP